MARRAVRAAAQGSAEQPQETTSSQPDWPSHTTGRWPRFPTTYAADRSRQSPPLHVPHVTESSLGGMPHCLHRRIVPDTFNAPVCLQTRWTQL